MAILSSKRKRTQQGRKAQKSRGRIAVRMRGRRLRPQDLETGNGWEAAKGWNRGAEKAEGGRGPGAKDAPSNFTSFSPQQMRSVLEDEPKKGGWKEGGTKPRGNQRCRGGAGQGGMEGCGGPRPSHPPQVGCSPAELLAVKVGLCQQVCVAVSRLADGLRRSSSPVPAAGPSCGHPRHQPA